MQDPRRRRRRHCYLVGYLMHALFFFGFDSVSFLLCFVTIVIPYLCILCIHAGFLNDSALLSLDLIN